MLNILSSKSFLSLSLILTLSATNVAYAEIKGKGHRHHPTGANDIVARSMVKTPTDNGFVRKTSKTNTENATANRTTNVVIDKEAGTRSRTVSGNNFKGETYSGESITHKTNTGYTTEGQRTGVDGKTTTRDVTAVVNKQERTLTRAISTTPEGGETTTKIKIVDLHKHH